MGADRDVLETFKLHCWDGGSNLKEKWSVNNHAYWERISSSELGFFLIRNSGLGYTFDETMLKTATHRWHVVPKYL